MNLDLLAGSLFVGTQALDAITTYYILTHGGKEANQVLITLGLASKPSVLLAVKIGLGILGFLVATMKGNQGYVPGEVSMLSVSAVTAYVAIHNLAEIIAKKA